MAINKNQKCFWALKLKTMKSDNHPIIKTKVPFIVRNIMSKTHLPENESELIQFSQELAKLIINDIEQTMLN